MKSIALKSSPVELPDSWDDLTPKQYLFTVKELRKLMDGEIDEFEFRFRLLLRYTGYKPGRRDYDAKRWLRFKLFAGYSLRAAKYYGWRVFGKLSKAGYKRIMSAVRTRFTYKPPQEPAREVIAHNLVQLADQLSFPFRNGKLHLQFSRNPLPKLPTLPAGKKFDIGTVLVTDFTAGEFFDALDIACAWRTTKKQAELDMLVAILYPAAPCHDLLSMQRHAEWLGCRLRYTVKYAVYLWFVSITEYFTHHPYYSLLYAGKPKNSTVETVKLGAGEAIIHLSAKGYGSHTEMRNKNLIEFMDLQLANLKDNISQALAAGIKPADLCAKTGLTLTQIEMLS